MKNISKRGAETHSQAGLTGICVLHVISSLGMGGAETWLMRLLEYYSFSSSHKIQFDFLITGGHTDIFDEHAKKFGARLYYINLNLGNVPRFIRRFRKLLREGNYDVIHDHQDILSGWHFMFGVGFLPRVRIAHVHNPSYQIVENYGQFARRRVQLAAGKLLLKFLATHFGGTSLQVLHEYGFTKNRFPRQWIGSLHCSFSIANYSGKHDSNKADLCREFGWPRETKIVLFLGRFDYSMEENHPQNHKNSVFALRVFEHIRDENVKMIMAGANEYVYREFMQLIKDKGLEEQVLLLGVRNDVPRVMLGSDLLFFPSRAEGLGMVAVEAQASGLPVVASTGVPRECVVIDELVHFISLSETHGAWARKIIEILGKGRSDSTQSDHRWMNSDFNIDVSVKKILSIYQGGQP